MHRFKSFLFKSRNVRIISTDSYKCENDIEWIRGLKLATHPRIQQIDGQNEACVWRWFIVPLWERRTLRTSDDVVTYSLRMRPRRVRVDSWTGVKRRKCDEGDYKSSVGHVEKINRPGKMWGEAGRRVW